MVCLVGKIIRTHLYMKQIPYKIGLRLRALLQSRQKIQEFLAAECRQHGFAMTRKKLAKYEIGMTQVPVRFVPIKFGLA
jgi:hypothetical protein